MGFESGNHLFICNDANWEVAESEDTQTIDFKVELPVVAGDIPGTNSFPYKFHTLYHASPFHHFCVLELAGVYNTKSKPMELWGNPRKKQQVPTLMKLAGGPTLHPICRV